MLLSFTKHGSPDLYFTMVQTYLGQVKIGLTMNATSENQAWSALSIKRNNPFRHIVRQPAVTGELHDNRINSTARQWKDISIFSGCSLFCLPSLPLLLVHSPFLLWTHHYLSHIPCAFGGPDPTLIHSRLLDSCPRMDQLAFPSQKLIQGLAYNSKLIQWNSTLKW